MFSTFQKELRDFDSPKHIVSFNGQYAYLIARGRLDVLGCMPRLAVTIDSRPFYYLLRIKRAVSLAQGSSALREIQNAGRRYDCVIVLGGPALSRSELEEIFQRECLAVSGVVTPENVTAQIARAAKGEIAPRQSSLLFLLFLGCPKQDEVAEVLHRSFGREFCITTVGLGGSLDFWSGRIRRAPSWMQYLCLEGLWRFVQEPNGERLRRLWVSLLGLLSLSPAAQRLKIWVANDVGLTRCSRI